jgi:hypothetical protein
MKQLLFVISLFLLLSSRQRIWSEEHYSRESHFSSIKLSQDDFRTLLSKIDDYMKSANPPSNSNVTHRIEVSEGERIINFSGSTANLRAASFPETCYQLSCTSFQESAAHESNSIYEVQMYFNDLYRSLKVEGGQPDRVDGLFLLLRDELDKAVEINNIYN